MEDTFLARYLTPTRTSSCSIQRPAVYGGSPNDRTSGYVYPPCPIAVQKENALPYRNSCLFRRPAKLRNNNVQLATIVDSNRFWVSLGNQNGKGVRIFRQFLLSAGVSSYSRKDLAKKPHKRPDQATQNGNAGGSPENDQPDEDKGAIAL